MRKKEMEKLLDELSYFTNVMMSCTSFYFMDMSAPNGDDKFRENAKNNFVFFTTNLTNAIIGILLKNGDLDAIKNKKDTELHERWSKFLVSQKEIDKDNVLESMKEKPKIENDYFV